MVSGNNYDNSSQTKKEMMMLEYNLHNHCNALSVEILFSITWKWVISTIYTQIIHEL